MDNQKTKIEKLYENEKSKGFINHLIHSYLPIYKVNKVWNFEDTQSRHKCSICGHGLVSISEVFGAMYNKQDEFMKAFTDSIKKDINGEPAPQKTIPTLKLLERINF